MSDSFLPPVILELRANAAEFIASTKEAREALGELGVEGDKAAAELDRATQRQIDAQERVDAANARSAEDIRADVDEKIEAERRYAEQLSADYDEEARRAQLTSAEIKRAADEQITAQREAADSAKELSLAQERAATVQDEAAAGSSGAFVKYGKLAAAATVAAAGVIGVESVKMAANFQSQITLLHTAGGESTKNLGMVAAGIKSIAESTGTSLDQLTEGAYTVEKAGYRGAAALNVLKMGAQGAIGEQVPLSTSMQALTDVMTDYHMKASQAAEAQDEISKAAGESKTTMIDFAGSLHSVVPLASSLHISFAQVGGAIAEMTQHGQTAMQSTQNLSNLITNLAGQNTVASSAMQQLGIHTIELQKDLGTKGLTGTLAVVDKAIKDHTKNGMVVSSVSKNAALATQSLTQMLGGMTPKLAALSKGFESGKVSYGHYYAAIKGMGGASYAQGKEFMSLTANVKGYSDQLKSGQSTMRTSASSLQKLLGGVTGMRAGMELGGANAKQFAGDVTGVGVASKHTGANVYTWAATSKTLAVQLSQVKEFVSVLLVDIGTKLIPIVSAATKFFLKHKDVLIAVAGVIGGVLIVNLAAFAAKMAWTAAETVGRVAVMVAGMAGLGPASTEAAAEFEVGIDGVVAASEEGAIATETAFGPIGLAVAAVGIAITLLASHWKQIWGVIKDVALDVWNDGLKPVFHFIESAFQPVIEAVKIYVDIWEEEFDIAKDIVLGIWNDVIEPVFGFIEDAFTPLIDIVKFVVGVWVIEFELIKDAVMALWNDVLEPTFSAIGSAFHALGTVFSDVYDATIKPVINFISTKWHETGEALKLEWNLIKTAWQNVWGAIKQAWNAVGKPVFDGLRDIVRDVVHGVEFEWDHLKAAALAVWSFLDKRVIHPIERLFDDMVGPIRSAVSKVSNVFRDIGSGLSWAYDHVIKPIISAIERGINDVKNTVGTVTHAVSGIEHVGGSALSHLNPFANGGSVPNGWFSTGERGPEIGYKSGSSVQIFSNSASQSMLAGAAGSGGGNSAGISDGQPVMNYITVQLNGNTLTTVVERGMLRKGLARGQAYQQFKK